MSADSVGRSRYGPRPRLGRVPGRGLSGLRVVPPAGERDRPLRRPAGIPGRGRRDGVEGLRTDRHSARAAVPATRADGRSVRDGARVAGRGLRIACFGSADLVRLDAAGRKRWLMQADEVLYLHPDRVRLQGPGIYVDADPLPDVVLEVDHTTDMRRRKLGIDTGGGFPALRVMVPLTSSVGAPGLTIHVRRGEVYREEPASRAFPGWKAVKIHHAPARKSDGRLEGDAHVRALRVRRPRGGPGATRRIREQLDLHAGLQQ